MLEDNSEHASDAGGLVSRIVAGDVHASLIGSRGGKKCGEYAEEGRLATTIGSEHAEDFSRFYAKRNIVEGRSLAVSGSGIAVCEVRNLDGRSAYRFVCGRGRGVGEDVRALHAHGTGRSFRIVAREVFTATAVYLFATCWRATDRAA